MSRTTQPASSSNAEVELAKYSWLTTGEVAELVGDVTETTVRGWIQGGGLRALNVGTQKRPQYRVRPDWVSAFMEQRTVNG